MKAQVVFQLVFTARQRIDVKSDEEIQEVEHILKIYSEKDPSNFILSILRQAEMPKIDIKVEKLET